jgi:hypothetical protein
MHALALGDPLPRLAVSPISLTLLFLLSAPAPTQLQPSHRCLVCTSSGRTCPDLPFHPSPLPNSGHLMMIHISLSPSQRPRSTSLHVVPTFCFRDFHCHMTGFSFFKLYCGRGPASPLVLISLAFISAHDISRSPPRTVFLGFYLSILRQCPI